MSTIQRVAACLLTLFVFSPAVAQTSRLIPAKRADNWKSSQTRLADVRSSDSGPQSKSAGKAPARGASLANGLLPNDEGQVWREYDLRPYTTRVEGVEHPELAVKDWILRETGTETWFHEPLSILSVSRDKVRVYHTPEMQEIVSDIIDRFVAGRPEPHAIGVRLITLQSPNWRIKALPRMDAVEVHSAGVEAWLVSRENAALVYAGLKKRNDFHEHSAGSLAAFNGQSLTVERRQARRYVKTIQTVRRDPWPMHKPEMGEINEGYTLHISSLFDEQGRSIDTVIRCHVDQIERLIPVTVNLPGFGNQVQRIDIQVQQLVSWRLHERFVWPDDKVLMLSCGVVASPAPQKNTISNLVGLPISTPFDGTTGRADAILILENNGTASQSMIRSDRTSRTAPNNHGRY